ncbi:type I-C CRISPR-associated endonuclease Cas1c [Thermopirellula anaerolimosa]
MKQHLNTLFVTTQGAYLKKDGEAVAVLIERKTRLRCPFINLGGLVCFGRVAVSPPLLGALAANGISVAFLSQYGRLLAVTRGFTPGNVILRRQQYRWADDAERSAEVARSCVLGKLANCRLNLRRAAREHHDADAAAALNAAANRLQGALESLLPALPLDTVRGIEGAAGADYFAVFSHLIQSTDSRFAFTGRSRRPPRDPVNALLSFTYALLLNDVRSACEAAGLDSQVGFLHRDRPGRPGLALDLMEELRPIIADRVVLNLINRRQVRAKDFQWQPSGAVLLSENARRTVLQVFQERKSEVVTHPFLGEKMTLGLVPHIQARLLARFIRGDIDAYPPCVLR